MSCRATAHRARNHRDVFAHTSELVAKCHHRPADRGRSRGRRAACDAVSGDARGLRVSPNGPKTRQPGRIRQSRKQHRESSVVDLVPAVIDWPHSRGCERRHPMSAMRTIARPDCGPFLACDGLRMRASSTRGALSAGRSDTRTAQPGRKRSNRRNHRPESGGAGRLKTTALRGSISSPADPWSHVVRSVESWPCTGSGGSLFVGYPDGRDKRECEAEDCMDW